MTPQDQKQQFEDPRGIAPVGGGQVRDQDKIMLVLAYLSIFALIPFLTVKDSEFVRFHARQGVVLFGFSVVTTFIPIVGCVAPFFFLGVSIFAIVKALGGERWRMPLVADLADRL
jgi:fumarate reductase subunit D